MKWWLLGLGTAAALWYVWQAREDGNDATSPPKAKPTTTKPFTPKVGTWYPVGYNQPKGCKTLSPGMFGENRCPPGSGKLWKITPASGCVVCEPWPTI